MDELGFQFWTHGMVKDRPAPGSQNPPYIWHMAALSRLSHLILFSHFANHSRKVVAQELLLIPIFVLKWYSATTCILYDILIICNWLYVFLTFFSTICMILWLSFQDITVFAIWKINRRIYRITSICSLYNQGHKKNSTRGL